MKLILTCHSTTSWLRTKICQGGDRTDSIARGKGNTQVEYNKEPSCGPEGGGDVIGPDAMSCGYKTASQCTIVQCPQRE